MAQRTRGPIFLCAAGAGENRGQVGWLRYCELRVYLLRGGID